MNFQYYLDFEDLQGLDRLKALKLENITFTYDENNNTVCCCNVKVDNYNELYVRKSSVINSLGKVFKFRLSSGEEAICVFIPNYDFLVSSIITRDFGALRECKIWLDQLVATIKFLDTCYMNRYTDFTEHEIGLNDLKLWEVIPKQFPINLVLGDVIDFVISEEGYPIFESLDLTTGTEETTNNGIVYDTIAKDLNNYNPSSISRIIVKQANDLKDKTFCCSTMLEYQVLIDSGILNDRIGLDVYHKSYSGFIEMASQNIRNIESIGNQDIVEYLVATSKDNLENLLYIDSVDHCGDDGRSYDFSVSKKIIKICIKKYGSLSEAPQEIIQKIRDATYISIHAVEYMRSFSRLHD